MNRPVDLALLAVPAAFTLLALALPIPEDSSVSLLAFVFLIVAFDVAHVWSTVYLSYANPEVVRRRRLLLALPIPLTLWFSYRVHLYDAHLFWTLIAYFAIYHFATQQWGFIALYKSRHGERDPLDKSLDKLALWTGAFGPIVYWHTLDVEFDWFGHGEQFIHKLDPTFQGDILFVMAVVAAVYVGRQVQFARQGRFNWGKNLWMLAVWASWGLAVYRLDHPLVSLACINLLHGIPFLALVWVRLHRYWATQTDPEVRKRSRFVSFLSGTGSSKPRTVWGWIGLGALFYVPLLIVAALEEGAWERYVWGARLAKGWQPSREQLSLCVAVLATPQIVHYILDGWLWKMDGSNPDLDVAFGKARPSSEA
ncbi:MAG: hypothetical protein JKY65_24925 [Planctomycetes bacterium]|nr:hypothetical protein [Planctomycetota bacterium]